MSIWRLVKLNFGRNLAHFGEVGIGMEETSDRIRSDSLFSAWISIYARLFGKAAVEEILQLFPTNEQPDVLPPFRVSSTFMYQDKGENKDIYYLPRPLKFPINYPETDLEFFKTYKKLNYLPLDIWKRWYQETGFTNQDAEELENYTLDKPNGKLVDAGAFNYNKTRKIEQLPKVAIDRNTRATNLYHTGFVQFACEKNPTGLYFLVELSPQGEKLIDKLKAALEFLGEEGIGGERSSGAGRFTVKWLQLTETWNKIVNFKNGEYQTLISLFWDSPIQEEFLNKASYDIQERGGWISESQLRRRMVRMFSEGSVFLTLPHGKLVDVTPDNFHKHRIYRSGISLSLPIKVKEEKNNG